MSVDTPAASSRSKSQRGSPQRSSQPAVTGLQVWQLHPLMMWRCVHVPHSRGVAASRTATCPSCLTWLCKPRMLPGASVRRSGVVS
jgi:hypothetical protein